LLQVLRARDNRAYVAIALRDALKICSRYCEHVTTGPTLLSPFVMHFVDQTDNKVFLVMCNCLYTPMVKDVKEFDATYDLKG
jgi:hypothetical protein